MIARTGRELGIVTDARYRFERGVDPEMMVPGAEIATKLVLELCGGEPTVLDVVGYSKPEPRVIDFPVSEVKRLTGIDVPYETSIDILSVWVSAWKVTARSSRQSFRHGAAMWKARPTSLKKSCAFTASTGLIRSRCQATARSMAVS
jgi:phenylalanyl-tRNA synthetase beta subunit